MSRMISRRKHAAENVGRNTYPCSNVTPWSFHHLDLFQGQIAESTWRSRTLVSLPILELRSWRLDSLFMTCAIPFGWLICLPTGLRWSINPKHFPRVWATGRWLLSDGAMFLVEHTVQLFALVMYAFVLARLIFIRGIVSQPSTHANQVYYIPNWLQLFPHI